MRIDNQNRTSFGHYYSATSANFSKAQKVVIAGIKGALEVPKENGKSLYKDLESKGIDILFSKGKADNEVGVTLVQGVKRLNSKSLTFSNSQYIDTFNRKDAWTVNECIELKGKENKSSLVKNLIYTGLFLAAIIGAPLVEKCSSAKESVVPKTEQLMKKMTPNGSAKKVAKDLISKLKPSAW